MTEPIVWSYSELENYRACPFRHQLAYIERWQQEAQSPALRRGSAWHAILATLYTLRQQGKSWDVAYRRAWKEHCVPPDGSEQTPEQLLLEWMMTGYKEAYQGDRQWTIVAVEVQEVVPITSRFSLKVRADLIVRLPNGRLWLVDAKSSRNLPSQLELQLHPQFALYVWALRRKGIPIWGSIHDCVRTQRNKQKPQLLEERFRRTLIHHTDQELQVFARDAYRDIKDAYEKQQRRGPNVDAPRHPDPERCRYRCDFTSACMAGMRSPDTEVSRRFLRDQGFTPDFTRH